MQLPLSYMAILIIVTLMSGVAEKNPKLCLSRNGKTAIRPDPVAALILSIALILMSGFRYFVGTDFGAYYRNRVTEWSTVWNSLVTFKEPGIKLLSLLSHRVWDNGQSLIIMTAVFTVGLYCWTIYRHHAMFLVSMLLYLFLGDWQGSFNVVRQYLAAAVMFAGHRYILSREFGKYCVVVLIASLFHVSAVVMIIPYFLLTREPDITQLVILTAGSVFLSVFFEVIFRFVGSAKGTVMNLTDPYLSTGVRLPRILVAFIPVVLYLVMCRKTGHTPEQNFYINAIFFNAFCMLASMGSKYLARIGIYTNATVVVGYGFLLQTIEDERHRIITIYILFGVYFAYWVYSLQRGSLIPFRWFF